MNITGKGRRHYPTVTPFYFGVGGLLVVWTLVFPSGPGHAALAAFWIVAGISAWIMSRASIDGLEVRRLHRPHVFEGDPVSVTLRVTQPTGFAQSLILVEDQFLASLEPTQRRLIPAMSPRWMAQLHYDKTAERHRGFYLLGPTEFTASDPLGIFVRDRRVDLVTTLTVHPRPIPLGGYRLLGPRPPEGATMLNADRTGQGEEIIGVRPYRRGDPPSRIHWRTSARRGELHLMELNTHVRGEVVIFLDLTRMSRFGTGVESTSEVVISVAASIMTEAAAPRHRIGMVWVRDSARVFPAGTGLGQLNLLLDRLAVVEPEGDGKFWSQAAPAAIALRPGARAIFVAPFASTTPDESCPLVRRLTHGGVAVDVILIDESNLIRIWKEQIPTHHDAEEHQAALQRELTFSGARVLPIRRGENAAAILPGGAGDD